MKSLEVRILDDIEKTGFAAELNAVSILINNRWSINHSKTYEDKDENKSREIDIISSKREYQGNINFGPFFFLIIEVKKSDKPWIIFTTEKPPLHNIGWRIINHVTNHMKPAFLNDIETFESVFGIECISRCNPRLELPRIGKAFHEFEKEPREKSKIYESLITSCKAAKYNCELNNSIDEYGFDLEKRTQVNIYLPIVEFDGKLFEVYNDEGGDKKVVKRDYIPVEMSYSSPNYREGNWDLDFFPDVVTLEYLEEYLEVLDIWRVSIINECSMKLSSMGKKPNKKYDS